MTKGFRALVQPTTTEVRSAYWFVFQKDRLLVRLAEGRASVPLWPNLSGLDPKAVRQPFLGYLDDVPCYAAELSPGTPWPQDLRFMTLLELATVMEAQMLKAAVTAVQIVNWDQTFQFCGRCGSPTKDHSLERMKICPQCGLTNFPRLAPAIMVAVIRQEQEILLANGRNFPADFYSVLAGFVEPGETLEECIHREVREEVGLAVTNLRYFGSQPWPFPHSLMVAFSADYAGGDIVVDGVEIRKADWFSANRLPRRPMAGISIAGRLIEWFRENRG